MQGRDPSTTGEHFQRMQLLESFQRERDGDCVRRQGRHGGDADESTATCPSRGRVASPTSGQQAGERAGDTQRLTQ